MISKKRSSLQSSLRFSNFSPKIIVFSKKRSSIRTTQRPPFLASKAASFPPLVWCYRCLPFRVFLYFLVLIYQKHFRDKDEIQTIDSTIKFQLLDKLYLIKRDSIAFFTLNRFRFSNSRKGTSCRTMYYFVTKKLITVVFYFGYEMESILPQVSRRTVLHEMSNFLLSLFTHSQTILGWCWRPLRLQIYNDI